MRIELLKETTLYVSDLDVAESFYTDIVGLVVAERVKDQHSVLQFDDGILILFQTPTGSIENEGVPSGLRELRQLSFGISPADAASWRKHLQEYDIAIEAEFAWPNGAQSILFRDPSGNRIELKTQKRHSQELASQELVKEELIRKEIPGGLNAKWKLYHALKLGGKRDSTSGD